MFLAKTPRAPRFYLYLGDLCALARTLPHAPPSPAPLLDFGPIYLGPRSNCHIFILLYHRHMVPPENTVFIVDDDPAICAALARLFRSVGLTAQSFCCAQEFLSVAPELGPGCLILDHRLPDLTGLELQGELVRAGIGLPIIFHTAHGSRSLREKALQAGAVGFLEKPVQDQALLTMVSQALARDRQANPVPGFEPRN